MIFRVFKYSHCSVECLVHALIYIDRLIQSRIIPVNSLTIHRIIITSAVLAIKYFDDSFYTDNQYARIGGIEVEELCFLEIEFLKSINFSLYVSCEDYQKYHNELYLHVSNGLCPCCSKIYCCSYLQQILLLYLYLLIVLVMHLIPYIMSVQKYQMILQEILWIIYMVINLYVYYE